MPALEWIDTESEEEEEEEENEDEAGETDTDDTKADDDEYDVDVEACKLAVNGASCIQYVLRWYLLRLFLCTRALIAVYSSVE